MPRASPPSPRRKRKTPRKSRKACPQALAHRPRDLLEPGARRCGWSSAASAPWPGPARICRRSSRWKFPSGRPRSRSSTSTAARSPCAAMPAAPCCRLKELPSYVPKAFIAIEDRRFYEHYGVDPYGIARALLANILHRGISQGASTITQQLAKNLFLTQERTVHRKLQEVLLAIVAGAQILQDADSRTLSQSRLFRRRRLRHRAGRAALFRKIGAPSFRLPEAAMLAGLVKSPSRLAPTRNFDGAEQRAQDRARRHGRAWLHHARPARKPRWRTRRASWRRPAPARSIMSPTG